MSNVLEQAQEKVDAYTSNLISTKTIDYVCLKDVESRPINWLWYGRIASGKVTLLAGEPGLGKSLITIDFAARVTTGTNWAVDNAPCEKGGVVVLSAEDDIADTIKPRLEACGGDPNKVFAIKQTRIVKDGEETERTVSLKSDLIQIEEIINNIPDCRLVIIDPITAYMEQTDSYKNTEVRSFLKPIQDMAEKTGTAILLVSHLNKSTGQNAMNRISGSIGLPAACRAAYSVSRDQDDDSIRYFSPIKNNLGVDSGSFTYTLEVKNEIPYIEWGDSIIDLTADEAMGSTHGESKSALDEAKDFLLEELSYGAMRESEIRKRAYSCDISNASLKRAKKKLGIKSTHEGGRDGHWDWHFPDGYFNGDHVNEDQPLLSKNLNPLNSLKETHTQQGFKEAQYISNEDQNVKGVQGDQDIQQGEDEPLRVEI
jgi:archaellum biogenesis ATPase FlaH